jgi:predicted lipase
VHSGFAKAHADTGSVLVAEVRRLLAVTGYQSVTLVSTTEQHYVRWLILRASSQVGHSLGGAVAELDALMFALQFPSITVKAVTYGTPRVGNPSFARFFDSKVCPPRTRRHA